MIPRMTWWQRILAWLLWKLEARDGFGGGFDDEMEGARWMLEEGHENYSYSVLLLRNYYYIKKHEEWVKNHGPSTNQQ